MLACLFNNVKRLGDIEIWKETLSLFLTMTKGWENCEFMSFVNHREAVFITTLIQYP